MVICTLLVLIWVLYSIAIVIFLGCLSELPPTPIFDMRDIGLGSAFILALAGWIAFTVFAAAYIFGG